MPRLALVSGPVVVQPDGGTAMPGPVGEWTVKVSVDGMTVIEFVCEPGRGPGLHRHRDEDELWYVMEGDFLFQAGDVRRETCTGGVAFGPRGLPHAFRNLGTTPGRLLAVTTPGGFDDFMRAVADEVTGGRLSPEGMSAIGSRFGIDFVGPPI